MKKRILPLWVVPVLIAMSIGTVWLRLSIVRTTYTITQSDQMIRNLELERQGLGAKLASQKSPRRLEALARARFGLSQPKPEQVVRVR